MAKYNIVNIFRLNKNTWTDNCNKIVKTYTGLSIFVKNSPSPGIYKSACPKFENERFPPFQPITAQSSSLKRMFRSEAGLSTRDAQLNQ